MSFQRFPRSFILIAMMFSGCSSNSEPVVIRPSDANLYIVIRDSLSNHIDGDSFNVGCFLNSDTSSMLHPIDRSFSISCNGTGIDYPGDFGMWGKIDLHPHDSMLIFNYQGEEVKIPIHAQPIIVSPTVGDTLLIKSRNKIQYFIPSFVLDAKSKTIVVHYLLSGYHLTEFGEILIDSVELQTNIDTAGRGSLVLMPEFDDVFETSRFKSVHVQYYTARAVEPIYWK